MSRKIFVLLGAPCSGKGTQCFLLKDLIPCVSAGDMLRRICLEGSDQRKKLDNGEFVEPEVVNKAVEDFVNSHNRSVVIDGYPRSDSQAAFISGIAQNNGIELTAIVLNTTDFDCLRNRMRNRTFCFKCQRTFTGSSVCCEVPTGKRKDDTDEIFEKRLDWYKNTINDISSAINNTIFIDAIKEPAEIHELIKGLIL